MRLINPAPHASLASSAASPDAILHHEAIAKVYTSYRSPLESGDADEPISPHGAVSELALHHVTVAGFPNLATTPWALLARNFPTTPAMSLQLSNLLVVHFP